MCDVDICKSTWGGLALGVLMKFAACGSELAVRSMLEAWAEEEPVQHEGLCKVRVSVRRFVARARGKSHVIISYHANTGNVQVQGPAAYLEEAWSCS